MKMLGILLVGFFFLFGMTGVHALTSAQVSEWDTRVNELFDSQGNLVEIQKYDDSFAEMNRTIQSLAWPVKSILNNQRIQIDYRLSPSLSKRFGLVIKDEELRSFTLGELSDTTLTIELTADTLAEMQSEGFEKSFPQAIKDGRIKVESKDFFHGIMIGIYKIFI